MSSYSKIGSRFLLLFSIVIVFVNTFLCQPVSAYNLEHQLNLDSKRKCIKCDLSGINLSGTFLKIEFYIFYSFHFFEWQHIAVQD